MLVDSPESRALGNRRKHRALERVSEIAFQVRADVTNATDLSEIAIRELISAGCNSAENDAMKICRCAKPRRPILSRATLQCIYENRGVELGTTDCRASRPYRSQNIPKEVSTNRIEISCERIDA